MILSKWIPSLLGGFLAAQAVVAIDITVNDQCSCFPMHPPPTPHLK